MPPNDGLPVKSPSSRPVGRHIRERSFASTMESPRHSAATCVSPGHYVPKSARRAHARSPSSGFSFPKSPSRRSSAESVVTDLVHAEELVGMDESHVAKAQQQFRRHSSSIAAKRETTVHEFEDRLQSIKDWLRAGVPVTVWDGRNKKVDALLYLNESTQSHVPSLEFKPHGAFLVGWRYSLKPLVLDHLLQAQMGVPGDFDGLESGDSLCMAVLHVAAGEEDPDRTVVLKCANEETKKQLYSGIRKLLTEASFRPKVVQPAPIVVGNSPEGSPRNSASNKEAKRKIGELEGELLEERTKYERVMLQMMETTNDINNKEEEIQRLRTELSHSQNELDALRKEKSLSIAASSQMNKKHNDLQFEFEEQQDELEVLKNKCRMLVEQLRIADQQCASIGAVSLPSAGTPN
jgi:myosin heavy subunit